MTQPEESREKTASTDAVLMHPENFPERKPAERRRPDERGEVETESDGDTERADAGG